MRKDLGIQADGDTLYTLRQQQRELDGQMHRLLFAAIVRQHPLRRFGIENCIKRKFTEACLDITRGGCAIARKDVAPVPLAIDEQVFLTQLHQGIANAGITVRVVLHGLPHDVGHLVHLAVIHALHGMKDTALNGLQAVLNGRHGTLQYHIRGIIEEPILVHTRQVVLDSIIKGLRLIGRMGHLSVYVRRCFGKSLSRSGNIALILVALILVALMCIARKFVALIFVGRGLGFDGIYGFVVFHCRYGEKE